jgi:protein involved in polysaccharide export with SLBB domain
MTIDLADTKAAATLVFPGDVITLKAQPPAPPQFFYIGGPVVAPGQKDFHAGMTLTQAVLASGGVTRFAGSKVKIARQGENGLLVSTEYNLKQIAAGKIPDPVLQPGDRLEVSRGGW